jgi:hypothetical protein
MKLPRVLLSALIVSVIAPCAFAQRADRHTLSDDAQSLYRRSAFAHGYIHGYEEGFHCGNLDWHMGRSRREVVHDLHILKIDKKRIAYREGYGDKKMFLKGYDQGYLDAYNDVFDGKPFRAVTEARAAAAGLSGAPPSRNFDDGFVAGINAVRDGQLASARDLSGATQSCIQNMQNASGEFCDAYARGVVFAGDITPTGTTQTAAATALR